GSGDWQLDPIALIPSGELVKTPGAVSATRREDNLYEVLVCNNFVDTVTRHVTDSNGGLQTSEVLLKKWISFPDGISVNENWIAISNHHSGNVFLYDWKTSLDDASSPDGILNYIVRPHGVRFTSDGRFLVVADYETPYLRIYERGDWGW